MDRLSNSTVASSTQDIRKDMLLRGANKTDDVSNTVKGALKVGHPLPRTYQLDKSGVVNNELTL